MTRPRKPRHATEEEIALWRASIREVSPLKARALKLRLRQAAPPVAPATPRPRALPPEPHLPEPKRPATSPPLADIDPRRARRLATGKLPIEARIDLHGLRQSEAREELIAFLRRAQDRGLKHVKVITGKGASRPGDERHLQPFSLYDDHRRGVLRDQVPRWLSDPACRSLVVGFTEAGRGHGGSGALYVQLRRKGRS
jgi:DNA-nicking Smr family endonuclease